jgi:phage shock protein PspC (stress-responsive transcriptional regulator)
MVEAGIAEYFSIGEALRIIVLILVNFQNEEIMPKHIESEATE